MSDKYQGFVSSPIGKVLVKNLGLPNPTKLERYTAGDPLVDGTVLVGGTGRLAESLPSLLDLLGIPVPPQIDGRPVAEVLPPSSAGASEHPESPGAAGPAVPAGGPPSRPERQAVGGR